MLVIGWLLGGTVGIGTLLFAVLIGPLVHVGAAAAGHGSRSEGAYACRAGAADARSRCWTRQCSRNSGQSLPGLICENRAFFATSIEGYLPAD